MAINFEAANMAGYNNPEMHIFHVTVNLEESGLVVVDAPSYSTITNIIKSGYIPALFVALPTGDQAVLPFAAINREGLYIFSAASHTADSPDKRNLISILFGEHFDTPHIIVTII